ncbi:hypothetical protein RYX36_025604 [Vicia faba]
MMWNIGVLRGMGLTQVMVHLHRETTPSSLFFQPRTALPSSLSDTKFLFVSTFNHRGDSNPSRLRHLRFEFVVSIIISIDSASVSCSTLIIAASPSSSTSSYSFASPNRNTVMISLINIFVSAAS